MFQFSTPISFRALTDPIAEQNFSFLSDTLNWSRTSQILVSDKSAIYPTYFTAVCGTRIAFGKVQLLPGLCLSNCLVRELSTRTTTSIGLPSKQRLNWLYARNETIFSIMDNLAYQGGDVVVVHLLSRLLTPLFYLALAKVYS